jgi:hypothetical protein
MPRGEKKTMPLPDKGKRYAKSVAVRAAVKRRKISPDAEVGKGNWTKEEDDLLINAAKQHKGKSWKDVERLVKTRNHVQCRQRWAKTLKPGLKPGQWKKSENDRLKELKGKGMKWKEICQQLGLKGRTARQCRERWTSHLDPSVRKGGWTTDEEKIVMAEHKKQGNRWSSIAKLLPAGRTANDVKIRWKSITRKDEMGKPRSTASQRMLRDASKSSKSAPMAARAVGVGKRGGKHKIPLAETAAKAAAKIKSKTAIAVPIMQVGTVKTRVAVPVTTKTRRVLRNPRKK